MLTAADFQPGEEGVFHGLPAEVYRRAPGISQSTLKKFDAEPTPAHYRESLTRKRKATEDMEFGEILHTAILEPKKLAEAFYVEPDCYPAKNKAGEIEMRPFTLKADWCKDWAAKHSDRTVITKEQEATISPIVASVRKLTAYRIIEQGQTEVSFFKKDADSGLLLKCRTDAICTDARGETWLADPKKVRRGFATAENFAAEVFGRGYHIQAASYLAVTGASHFVFIAMEDEAPFEARAWSLDDDALRIGWEAWRKMLLRYQRAFADGTWEGYPQEIQTLPTPYWLKRRAVCEQ